jgi:O-methyltransferase
VSLRQRAAGRALRELRRALDRHGYDLVSRRDPPMPPDYDQATVELFRRVKPYTLTSHERVAALRQAVLYVSANKIPGAMVECGVWRGGSMMAVAATLVEAGDIGRDLWLYDTFTSMPAPGDEDVDVWGGRAIDYYDEALANPGYAYLPKDEVRRVVTSTGYPPERIRLVQGMVEETIPAEVPDEIALLRLDTDWYRSTAHEMEHLFPRIAAGGVLIIDDYGHFQGAKKAVDEYFNNRGLHPLLNRVDFTGRLVLVTPELR